jgi:hypothetical protein
MKVNGNEVPQTGDAPAPRTGQRKTQAHIRYRDESGNVVPGVTTILNVLNKPALVAWANRLGLEGVDSNQYRDEFSDVGTLAHYLVVCHFNGQEPITTDYSQEQIDLANNCLKSFHAWLATHEIEPIVVETPLVSSKLGYGGTIDLYCFLNGVPTLVDFKTGKTVVSEMFHQLAAYKNLLEENGSPVEQARILRIGRTADEGFDEHIKNDLSTNWEIFQHCLAIYALQKRS